MESLSVLSGGVAHDLNNVLGPMVALPDVILQDLGQLDPASLPALTEIRDDMRSIKSASLRAAQTIKDLLTLGRQGRRPKADLDLNRLVKSCILSSPWAADSGSTAIHLRIDLAPESLPLRGAESQLARAVSNLMRNAFEAVDGHGDVTI